MSRYEVERLLAQAIHVNEHGAQAVQWAPNGGHLEGQPGPMRLFLAGDGPIQGFAGGPGGTLTFGSASGDLDFLPGQWAVRHADGRFTVEDEFRGARQPFDPVGCRYHFMPGGIDHHYDCTCGGESDNARWRSDSAELV